MHAQDIYKIISPTLTYLTMKNKLFDGSNSVDKLSNPKPQVKNMLKIIYLAKLYVVTRDASGRCQWISPSMCIDS